MTHCPKCGSSALIREDGEDICIDCGWVLASNVVLCEEPEKMQGGGSDVVSVGNFVQDDGSRYYAHTKGVVSQIEQKRLKRQARKVSLCHHHPLLSC